MRSNRLCLNPEKTDFMWCVTRRRCMHLDTSELSVCGALIRPSTTVRDLGVLLESDLSMRRHAIAAFVTSKVDRYISLLASAPACLLDGLQSVLNAAARLICNRRKYDRVTPLLRDVFHWLPVPFRIEYKLYSSSYHFTELLQSTCAIAALGLIPPRLGYIYDHMRRPIFGCGG